MSPIVLDLQPTYAIELNLVGDEGSLTIATDPTAIVLDLVPALRGEPGLAGSGGIEFSFAWGDASPRNVTLALTGKLVYGVGVHIEEAFDGVGPQISVGDSANAQRLMPVDKNDPSTVGTYETSPVYMYGSDTFITITIAPGVGATAGKGLLTILIQQ